MIHMVHAVKHNWIEKHLAPTAASGILLLTLAAKIAHILPLVNLEEKFLEDSRASGYSLWPATTDFFRLNPKKLSIMTFGADTLIVQDATKKKTFTLTCPDSQEYCLIRENPYSISITGTVFGSGESIPKGTVHIILGHALQWGTLATPGVSDRNNI